MAEAYICDAVRTPIGRYGGMFTTLTAVDLARNHRIRAGLAPERPTDRQLYAWFSEL